MFFYRGYIDIEGYKFLFEIYFFINIFEIKMVDVVQGKVNKIIKIWLFNIQRELFSKFRKYKDVLSEGCFC